MPGQELREHGAAHAEHLGRVGKAPAAIAVDLGRWPEGGVERGEGIVLDDRVGLGLGRA